MTTFDSRSRSAGFSLIEFLAVSAIAIAILGFGIEWFAGADEGPALRGAEVELAGLLGLTRTHAIRANRPARLLIRLDASLDDPERRTLAIVQRDPATGDWRLLDPPHVLAPEAAIAPSTAVGAWPSALQSVFNGEMSVAISGLAPGIYGYVHFASEGTTFGNPQLVLASVRASSGAMEFAEPQRARIFLVRSSGSVSLRRGIEL